MKKRKIASIVWFLVLSVVGLGLNSTVWAQPERKAALQKSQKKPVLATRAVNKLPDLIVSDIRLIKDCKIQITIKNIGTAGVPASGYDLQNGAAIQMFNGSKAWGGIRLGAIDRSGRLKTPGASVRYVWFPRAANLALAAGTHSIKLVVDNNNAVKERNENNNSKTSRLRCKKPLGQKQKSQKKPVLATRAVNKLPDLIVSDIRLIKDCKMQITIKNIGTAGVPASGYDLQNGAAIQMFNGSKAWGGIRLGAIDRSGRLKTPGASVRYVWFPGAANLALAAGTHSIKLVVDNNNAVKERNENNNSKTSRLRCKKPAAGTPKPLNNTSQPNRNQPRHGGAFGQLNDQSPQAPSDLRANIPESLSGGISVPVSGEPAKPADLALEMFSMIPQKSVIGVERINMYIRVTNIGDRATSANTEVTLQFGDYPYVNHPLLNLEQWTVPRLGPGEKYVRYYKEIIPEHYTRPGESAVYNVESGAYRFMARIDTSTLTDDEKINYSNDAAQLIFQLTSLARPDLVVCFSKDVVSRVGSMAKYEPVVKNRGNAPSDPMNLRFYIHPWGEKNFAVPGLPAGGTYSGIMMGGQWHVGQAGEHNYNLWVDNNHDVIESNDANNIIKGTIHVSRRFAAQGLTTSPAQCSNVPGMAD